MSIVNSTYSLDAHYQSNGDRYVTEHHTDNLGMVHQIGPYLISPSTDIDAIIANRVAKLNEQLSESEIEKYLAYTTITITLQHQTAAQFAARFWDKLQQAYSEDKIRYCRMIWWLSNKVTSGELTSNDIRLSYNNFFNKSLTITQWNTLVNTRFIPARDRYQAMLDEDQV
jgi:hypothetical protein